MLHQPVEHPLALSRDFFPLKLIDCCFFSHDFFTGSHAARAAIILFLVFFFYHSFYDRRRHQLFVFLLSLSSSSFFLYLSAFISHSVGFSQLRLLFVFLDFFSFFVSSYFATLQISIVNVSILFLLSTCVLWMKTMAGYGTSGIS